MDSYGSGVLMSFLKQPFGLAPVQEKTYVSLRCISYSIIRSRHWDSEVFYDDWGAPFVYGCAQRGYDKSRITSIRADGRANDGPWPTEWRHKSGPEVDFNRRQDPKKSWYPKNPNNDIPL